VRKLTGFSPYELLCASKPQPAPTHVTRYDLYSKAQQSAADGDILHATPVAEVSAAQTFTQETPAYSAPIPPSPAKRTHYIANIQSRHTAASGKTRFTNQPLT